MCSTSDGDDSDADVPMGPVEGTNLLIKDMAYLDDGYSMRISIACDLKTDVIPHNLVQTITSEAHDKQRVNHVRYLSEENGALANLRPCSSRARSNVVSLQC